MEAALFFEEHKQVLTEDSLWCILTMGGFTGISKSCTGSVADIMLNALNRNIFSVTLWAVKK